MKEYIKTLSVGLITGAAAMQLVNMAVQSLAERSMQIGGEIFLPILILLALHIGWKLAYEFFADNERNEIYRRGLEDGMKIHNYQIVISADGESIHESRV